MHIPALTGFVQFSKFGLLHTFIQLFEAWDQMLKLELVNDVHKCRIDINPIYNIVG